MVLELIIWWEYELDFYLKSSLCQCSHRTRSGWLGLLSLLALWSHRGNGMRSQGSSALIPGSTSPILSPELEQEQGIPSEFCYILGSSWGSLNPSQPLNVERKEKTVFFQCDKYLIPLIHHLIIFKHSLLSFTCYQVTLCSYSGYHLYHLAGHTRNKLLLRETILGWS